MSCLCGVNPPVADLAPLGSVIGLTLTAGGFDREGFLLGGLGVPRTDGV